MIDIKLHARTSGGYVVAALYGDIDTQDAAAAGPALTGLAAAGDTPDPRPGRAGLHRLRWHPRPVGRPGAGPAHRGRHPAGRTAADRDAAASPSTPAQPTLTSFSMTRSASANPKDHAPNLPAVTQTELLVQIS
jgi:hypothetical protein